MVGAEKRKCTGTSLSSREVGVDRFGVVEVVPDMVKSRVTETIAKRMMGSRIGMPKQRDDGPYGLWRGDIVVCSRCDRRHTHLELCSGVLLNCSHGWIL